MNKRVWILASGLCLMVSVAMADNYVVKNGQGSLITFAAKSVGSVLHPLSIMEGLIGGAGAPAAVNVDSGGVVQMNNTSMVNNLSSIASSNTAIAASAATIATNTGNTNPVPVTFSLAPTASVAISSSTSGTIQLVALSSGKAIYVTSALIQSAGGASVTLEYGTGSNCGTGTMALTGVMAMTAQNVIPINGGMGAALFVPASNALCLVNSANVQISGAVAYAQK